jgi:hypothetical protein
MPGSGTMARDTKGPREASQLLGIQYVTQSPNCPLVSQGSRVGLTPRLEKANCSRRRFTPHLIMTMEPCEGTV